MSSLLPVIDAERHYEQIASGAELEGLLECEAQIRNIGWTLGNDCPYRCRHCYSMSARRKGRDLEPWMVDLVVQSLVSLGVETVNLGGNEPLFTNGINPQKTLLPYIIDRLSEVKICVGLTTSGISLIHLQRDHFRSFQKLNDVDISVDSPFPDEHNKNRGAPLFPQVLESLRICHDHVVDHSIIMCAMRWNFTDRHLDGLLALAREYGSNIRINPFKPIEPQHQSEALTPEQFYRGFARLMSETQPVDLGEPLLASTVGYPGKGCPCGRASFRIHSITPDGRIPISPCVYLHDYKVGDILTDDIHVLVNSPQFRAFRRRNGSAHAIPGCEGCQFLASCRGGCAARAYLHQLYETGERTLRVKDPFCLAEQSSRLGGDFPQFAPVARVRTEKRLVHQDYLCTWIGAPVSPAAGGYATQPP
jgi:radical SAM protein with 4Fe4S-binding SPASM domain